jgi:hypothetical protein
MPKQPSLQMRFSLLSPPFKDDEITFGHGDEQIDRYFIPSRR